MENTLVLQIAYYGVLGAATYVGFKFFVGLGDVTQKLLNVTRKLMVFCIRHEYKMIFATILGTTAAWWIDAEFDVDDYNLWYYAIYLNGFFILFPWTWLHIGLRNKQNKAKYYPQSIADKWVLPKESVIVIDNNGAARAHSDYHIKRPHLASTPEGLGGENVMMSYCCMTHLGLGFKPEIDGERLDLEVLAQIGNNLIMRDENTGEPIQQVYGTRECDGRFSEKAMQQWPTYRMTYRGFKKAFPEGTVFLNLINPFWKNPFLYFYDHLIEAIFLWGTVAHHRQDRLMFDTMDQKDDRLHLKELVNGFNVGKDSVAYTEDFLTEHGNLINVKVGGRDIVIAHDPEFESTGVYYNDTGKPVSKIDFWGKTDTGDALTRVETVKAEIYWSVWYNYYPETDLNRLTNN